jgi:hypothetical protein
MHDIFSGKGRAGKRRETEMDDGGKAIIFAYINLMFSQ